MYVGFDEYKVKDKCVNWI